MIILFSGKSRTKDLSTVLISELFGVWILYSLEDRISVKIELRLICIVDGPRQ